MFFKSPSEAIANKIEIDNVGKKYFGALPDNEKTGLSFLVYCMNVFLRKPDNIIFPGITEACHQKVRCDDFGIDGLIFSLQDGTVNIFNCQYSDKERKKEIGTMERGLKFILLEDTKEINKINNESFKKNVLKIRKNKDKIKKIKIYYCTNSLLMDNTENAQKIEKEEIQHKEYYSKLFSSVLKTRYKKAELDFYIMDAKKVFFHKKRDDNPLAGKKIIMKSLDGFKDFCFSNEILEASGLIVTISGREIANIVKKYNNVNDCLFDQNIRGDLGEKNEINRDKIKETTFVSGNKFWFLNNGITIICSDLSPSGKDKKKLILEFPQIVNGQQTAKSLERAAESKKFSNDVKVVCRIYKTSDPTLIDCITEASNTQSVITKADLVSNKTEQRAIEDIFLSRGFLYKRKKKDKYDTGVKIRKKIDKKFLARVGLCIFGNKPHEARLASVNKLFNEKIEDSSYGEIFKSDPLHLLMAYLIWSDCKSLDKETSYHRSLIVWNLAKEKITKKEATIDNFIEEYKRIREILKEEYAAAKKIIKEIPKKYQKDKKTLNEFLNSEKSKIFIFKKINKLSK